MSKGPDLSAFPIPRKGKARPLDFREEPEAPAARSGRAGEGSRATPPAPAAPARPDQRPPLDPPAPRSPPTGQVIAATVKLDENRYLRLVAAGQPGPGRLKRRSIQDMMIEAVDEWFERRGL